MIRKLFALALAGAMLVGGTSAFAATVCSAVGPNVTFNVTGSIGCEALAAANDDATVVDGMFGFDWDLLDRVGPPPGVDGALSLVGSFGTRFGDWSILPSVFATYEHVMLIFKGDDAVLPQSVVGYLVDATGGTYATPFYIFDNSIGSFRPRNISHVSLYVSGEKAPPPAVPVPAAGLLLIGGLGAFAALRRKA